MTSGYTRYFSFSLLVLSSSDLLLLRSLTYLDQELGPIYLTEMAERSDTAFLCRNVCWIQKSISYKNLTGSYFTIYNKLF